MPSKLHSLGLVQLQRNENVQKFILDLIIEVVIQYDVAGIQLDYHFGLPVELGYDSFTVRLYQQEHQGKSSPNDPLDSEWMRWRADRGYGGVLLALNRFSSRYRQFAIAVLMEYPFLTGRVYGVILLQSRHAIVEQLSRNFFPPQPNNQGFREV